MTIAIAMADRRRPWAALMAVASIWLAVSAAAMLAYAARYHFRWTLLGPHLAVVCVLLALLLAAGLVIARLRIAAAAKRMLVVALLSVTHLLLLACYAMFFVAWEAWNQAVSLGVIAAYLPQLPQLLLTLPVSVPLAAAALVAVLGAIALPYAVAAQALLRGLEALAESLLARYRGWMPAWRAAVLATTMFAVPALIGHAAWSGRAAAAALHEPFFQAVVAPGKEIGAMTLDAGAAARALAERAAAAAYAPPASFRRKNLVVITVDALRADQMSVYGFARETTPFLKKLHAEGRLTRFERAYSVCTESFCGLLAVLTSKYWHQAALENFGLPEVLKRLGYRVTFLLGGDHTNFYGLRGAYGQAIDEYRDGSMAAGYMNDDRNVLEWLAAMRPEPDTPQFLVLHLMSVHTLGQRLAPYRRWEPSAVGLRGLGAEEALSAYINNYHNGVLQADAMLERIFGLLRDKRLLDDAVVVITADHGEMLGERGRMGHARSSPDDPLVRVPLMIFDSDRIRYPARAVASQVDVAPTLLHRIGAPVPPNWAGEALDLPARRESILIQAGSSRAVVAAAGGALWKYVAERGEGTQRLFNLTRDPAESEDVLPGAEPQFLARLRAAADAMPR
jgi:hypothetical protein